MDTSIPLAWLEPGWTFALVAVGLLFVALAVRGASRRVLGGSRYDTATRRFEEGLLALLILGMIALSVIQIILRNVFESGWIWIDPMLRALVLWLAFLGAIAATAKGRHIAIDALSRVLPEGRRGGLTRALALLSAVVCLALANGAWEFLRLELEFPSEAFAGLQTWQVQSILLFGSWMLAYRFAVIVLFGLPPGARTESPA